MDVQAKDIQNVKEYGNENLNDLKETIKQDNKKQKDANDIFQKSIDINNGIQA